MASVGDSEDWQRSDRAQRSGALRRLTGEFRDPQLERSFIRDNWTEIKRSPSNAMLVGGLIFLAFVAVDLLSGRPREVIIETNVIRLLTCVFLVGSAIYIKRAREFFRGFYLLTVLTQVLISAALIRVGHINQLTFTHNMFNVLLVTFGFYLFINQRFVLTVIAGVAFPTAFITFRAWTQPIEAVETVRFFLYFMLANGLGMALLNALNRDRRASYAHNLELTRLNDELEQTVSRLEESRQEITALRGLLPICCKCKKIRDDDGLWNQVEQYISHHSEAEFSHGICPECVEELYPEQSLNLKTDD